MHDPLYHAATFIAASFMLRGIIAFVKWMTINPRTYLKD